MGDMTNKTSSATWQADMAEAPMTDAERAEHYRKALERISEPNAFYVATSDVDPETFARMVFAEATLGDHTLAAATAKTEFETRQRYAPKKRHRAPDDELARLRGLVQHYERVLTDMQDCTFFAEEDDGVLRRWHPPKPLKLPIATIEPN